MNVSLIRTVILGLLFTALPLSAFCEDEDMGIMVPSFEGELGENVGTVLWLKVWRSLRDPLRHGAPSAAMWFTDEVFRGDQSFEDVENDVARNAVAVVLWGNTIAFGDGVLAQPRLCIIPNKVRRNGGENPVTWQVVVSTQLTTLRLEVTIPQTRYQLPPIMLDNSLLSHYPNVHLVPVYRRRYNGPPAGEPIGKLGSSFRNVQNDGDYSEVIYDDDAGNGHMGWVYFPELKGDIPIVDYVIGIIRLLRCDYQAAIDMLSRSAASADNTSAPLKIDSLLMEALATAKLKRDPGVQLELAEKLNPYLQSTAKFKIVYLISKIQAGPTKNKQASLSALESEIAATSYIFPLGDPWLETAKQMLYAMRQ